MGGVIMEYMVVEGVVLDSFDAHAKLSSLLLEKSKKELEECNKRREEVRKEKERIEKELEELKSKDILSRFLKWLKCI